VESQEELEARLRAQLHAPTPSPLEATREFLQEYCGDAYSLDEVRRAVVFTKAHRPRRMQAILRAIETVIADPPRDGTLSYMVAVDANYQLDDPSDEGALEYLRDIVNMLHGVLEPE
jgi:hypothetical protein